MNNSHIQLMVSVVTKARGYLKTSTKPDVVAFHKGQLKAAIEILQDLNERVNKMKNPKAYKEVMEYINETKTT